ncbi:hypothetical protein [Persicobacter psychrovividus]
MNQIFALVMLLFAFACNDATHDPFPHSSPQQPRQNDDIRGSMSDLKMAQGINGEWMVVEERHTQSPFKDMILRFDLEPEFDGFGGRLGTNALPQGVELGSSWSVNGGRVAFQDAGINILFPLVEFVYEGGTVSLDQPTQIIRLTFKIEDAVADEHFGFHELYLHKR